MTHVPREIPVSEAVAEKALRAVEDCWAATTKGDPITVYQRGIQEDAVRCRAACRSIVATASEDDGAPCVFRLAAIAVVTAIQDGWFVGAAAAVQLGWGIVAAFEGWTMGIRPDLDRANAGLATDVAGRAAVANVDWGSVQDDLYAHYTEWGTCHPDHCQQANHDKRCHLDVSPTGRVYL
jgi:hypothetical protein